MVLLVVVRTVEGRAGETGASNGTGELRAVEVAGCGGGIRSLNDTD